MKRITEGTFIFFFCLVSLVPAGALFLTVLSKPAHLWSDLQAVCLNARALRLMANSFMIGAGASLVALAVGVPLGFLISRTNIYFRKAAGYLVFLPLIIPDYISAMAWITFLTDDGSINKVMGSAVGFEEGLLNIYGSLGVVWVLGIAYFPFVCLLTMAGLASLDRRLEEQALSITDPGQVIRQITLPLLMPFICAGALFVFIFSIANYGVPTLLRINTYPLEIFAQFSVFYDPHRAVLSCLPLLLITTGLTGLCYYFMRDRSYVTLGGSSTFSERILLKKYRVGWSLVVWGIIFISGILPIIVLVKSAGSWESYRAAISSSLSNIGTSLGLASLSATVCVVLGFYMSYLIEREGRGWRKGLDILTLMPLALPPTVMGIGLIKLWNHPATAVIYGSFMIVVLGMVGRFVPFTIRILAGGFKQLHPNMEEAAVLEGHSSMKIITKILAPLNRQGLLAGWAICFIFCMGELGTTLLVVPAGVETLSNKVFTLLHYGVGRLTSALSVVLVFITLIPILALYGLERLWKGFYDPAK